MADSPLSDRPPEFWEAVGADYYGNNDPILVLCQRHGITIGEFNRAKAQLDWRRRKTKQVSRERLIAGMFRLLDRYLSKLENDMTDIASKEVTVLNSLATTLGKLIDIEDSNSRARKPRQTKDMHDIRNRLVQRIEELKRA